MVTSLAITVKTFKIDFLVGTENIEKLPRIKVCGNPCSSTMMICLMFVAQADPLCAQQSYPWFCSRWIEMTDLMHSYPYTDILCWFVLTDIDTASLANAPTILTVAVLDILLMTTRTWCWLVRAEWMLTNRMISFNISYTRQSTSLLLTFSTRKMIVILLGSWLEADGMSGHCRSWESFLFWYGRQQFRHVYVPYWLLWHTLPLWVQSLHQICIWITLFFSRFWWTISWIRWTKTIGTLCFRLSSGNYTWYPYS